MKLGLNPGAWVRPRARSAAAGGPSTTALASGAPARWPVLVVVGALGPAGALAALSLGFGLRAADPWALAWALVAAPLVEEFIFRGLVQRGLDDRRSGGGTAGLPWLVPLGGSANLATAALFALAHVQVAGPSLAPWLILPSLVLGWCWARHRSVLLCAAAHAWFNLCLVWVGR